MHKQSEKILLEEEEETTMANLQSAMDSNFWDMNVSTSRTLDATARKIPGDPIPLDGARGSRVLRVQQLSILGEGFPLGVVPSWCSKLNEDSSLSLESLLLKPSTTNWWLGLIGQFHPKKMIYSIRQEVDKSLKSDARKLSKLKNITKHVIDKSLYSLGLCTQLSLTPASSLLLSTEQNGMGKGRRSKAMFFHQLPDHDITLEAAWPELFIDRNGEYWDVPESISLDLASLLSESGLRYRFGIHKNSGHPQSLNASICEPPLALMPGLCSKAGISYEKTRDIWRPKEKIEDIRRKIKDGVSSYDERLSEPHAAISGIIGGTCSAWFGGKKGLVAEGPTLSSRKRNPLDADLFGSICCTYQHGKFTNNFGDLTRVDSRLDISSVKDAAHQLRNVLGSSATEREANPIVAPRLSFILQQQVAGPIVFRVDSRFALGSTSEKGCPHVEDVMYSLCYSLRALQSGKVVAWYSPKRKEGMIELRLFEF